MRAQNFGFHIPQKSVNKISSDR